MSDPAERFSCRASLSAWRALPTLDFPAPYHAFSAPLAELARNPAAARLVDGIVLRILRGDSPATIASWALAFATRRAITLPPGIPP